MLNTHSFRRLSLAEIQNPNRRSTAAQGYGVHRRCGIGWCAQRSRRILAVEARVPGARTECAEKTEYALIKRTTAVIVIVNHLGWSPFTKMYFSSYTQNYSIFMGMEQTNCAFSSVASCLRFIVFSAPLSTKNSANVYFHREFPECRFQANKRNTIPHNIIFLRRNEWREGNTLSESTQYYMISEVSIII